MSARKKFLGKGFTRVGQTNRFLKLPHVNPKTPKQMADNMRHLERWGNKLPVGGQQPSLEAWAVWFRYGDGGPPPVSGMYLTPTSVNKLSHDSPANGTPTIQSHTLHLPDTGPWFWSLDCTAWHLDEGGSSSGVAVWAAGSPGGGLGTRGKSHQYENSHGELSLSDAWFADDTFNVGCKHEEGAPIRWATARLHIRRPS